jgi:hypothetical protein
MLLLLTSWQWQRLQQQKQHERKLQRQSVLP